MHWDSSEHPVPIGNNVLSNSKGALFAISDFRISIYRFLWFWIFRILSLPEIHHIKYTYLWSCMKLDTALGSALGLVGCLAVCGHSVIIALVHPSLEEFKLRLLTNQKLLLKRGRITLRYCKTLVSPITFCFVIYLQELFPIGCFS